MTPKNNTPSGRNENSGNEGGAGQEQRELRSRDIFGDTNSITIIHDDARYVLRITKQNKLILTK